MKKWIAVLAVAFVVAIGVTGVSDLRNTATYEPGDDPMSHVFVASYEPGDDPMSPIFA